MAYTTINKSGDYFNTVLYTGNATDNRTVTGVGFQPDWLWIKNRADTEQHRLQDAVRGATKNLKSSGNGVEETTSTNVKSFDSDGFTLGTDNAVNGNSDNMVSWNWKAGTTGSGTSTGSGTGKAYTYSVNTTAGFSIIRYLGNGTADHTIPHHLGAEPHWIIIKQLTGTYDWRVYFRAEGNQKIVRLNTTGTATSSTDYWNNTTPTSTVFNLGTGGGVNADDVPYIAYCFAPKTGYSKMGQYKGNGNANGTFVYTGFKPSVIIIKDADNAENWFIFDNKRPGYNLNANHLNPNDSGSETNSSANTIDILSNGFKMRATNNGINRSGGEGFNYLAIGQSLVGSNNIPCTAR
jgi:hypothetical protein